MHGPLRGFSACVFLVSALAVAPAHAGDRDLHDGTHDDPEMRRTVEGWRRDLDREIASIENDATLIEGVRLYEMGLWINSRIDFACGRDQATIYFAIGEAF